MMGTPEGHVESVPEEEATLANDLDDEAEGDSGSSTRRSWKDSVMCSITYMNSLFTGD